MARPKGKVAAALAEIDSRIDANAMLTDEEKLAAREKAREHVLKQRKEKAMDAYLARAIAEEERSYVPEEQLEDILIDLPKFSASVVLDNVFYYHGLVYTVPYSQARAIADIMARSWEHQNEIDGHRRRGDDVLHARQLQRPIGLKPGMENASPAQFGIHQQGALARV